ncbi:MAG: hypothetical protein HUJ56_07565 [Erysipelotrichaceae bacterium]|nr:hypothetical protein [Erysipelotrichaceae bacterium]
MMKMFKRAGNAAKKIGKDIGDKVKAGSKYVGDMYSDLEPNIIKRGREKASQYMKDIKKEYNKDDTFFVGKDKMKKIRKNATKDEFVGEPKLSRKRGRYSDKLVLEGKDKEGKDIRKKVASKYKYGNMALDAGLGAGAVGLGAAMLGDDDNETYLERIERKIEEGRPLSEAERKYYKLHGE